MHSSAFLAASVIPSLAGEKEEGIKKIVKTDEEWKKQLTAEEYRVLRTAGTEPAYKNAYWDHHSNGQYVCAGCGLGLFESTTKFDSGTGWPSFYKPQSSWSIGTKTDNHLGFARTEVHCARCSGHLGHVFKDAPETPTGLRYCMNSVSLKFVPAK